MKDIHFVSQGNGLPLIFQHGLAANSQQIIKLLGSLSGIQLLTLDCPGHGISELSDNYLPSFNRYSDDVIRVAMSQKIEQACLGGLSMGAGIAINIALRFPEKVTGLILLRPAWLSSSNPPNLITLLKAASFIGEDDYHSSLKELASYNVIERSNPRAAQSILGIFGAEQQPSLASVIRYIVNDKPIAKMSDLVKINVPCLIIVNDDDPLHPVSIGEILNENITKSSLVKVASRYIEPDLHRTQVRAHIAEFIKKLK